MDRLPQNTEQCHSPSDQLFPGASSLIPMSSPWPPAPYPMSLDQAQSNPATPEGYDVQCFSNSMSLGGLGAPADYFHLKRPPSSSSMGHSPSSYSEDPAHFGNGSAAQAPQSHLASRPDPSSVSEHPHYPLPYSLSGVPQTSGHSQPHLGPASMPNQTEASMFQRGHPAIIRLPNSSFRTEDPNHMQHGRTENQARYNLAFNGMVPPPPPSPTYPVDWSMMHHNNPAYTQGIPARLPHPYVPVELLDPVELNAAMSCLTPEQLQRVCANLPYHTLVQQHIEHGYDAEARAARITAAAYDMNRTGGSIPYSHPNSSGAISTEYARAAIAAGPHPVSQSTMSTPSLSAPSPNSTWSPAPEQHLALVPGPSAVYATYPATAIGMFPRDPPTPPTLPDGAMPPSPTKCCQKKSMSPTSPAVSMCHRPGDNRSISSVLSERSTSSSVPVTPSSAAPIPLRVRVALLPKDKRVMFERAAGELWDPKSSEEDHEYGLDRAQAQLLEDLYALIGSKALRTQSEIPDELVEPILTTKLLPRADAHRGSRGGAAGHLCLWYGCGKEIKRLDHSRNHIREHCKSKPHTCGGHGLKGCDQTFLRTDDLKRHQKSHCSVLRSGPGRRPRSIRGTRRRDADEEEEEHSEDAVSLDGGDDDDYRPIHERANSSASSTTRELASRLRRQRTSRFVVDESTSESDSNERSFGRHQTSHVRHAVESPVEHQHRDYPCGDEDGVGGERADHEKVWLAYSALMAGCSLRFITALIVHAFYLYFIWPLCSFREVVRSWSIDRRGRCGVRVGWRRPCGETIRMILTA